MSSNALLVTALHRESEGAQWRATTESLVRELDTSTVNTTNARCVLEAVIYTEPDQEKTE